MPPVEPISKPNRFPPSVPTLRPGGWLNPSSTPSSSTATTSTTPSSTSSSASPSRSHSFLHHNSSSFSSGPSQSILSNGNTNSLPRTPSGMNTPGDQPAEGTTIGGPKKPKDLSHVPCKFFKSGGCTAGSACVFAHVVAEPGQQKQTCQYFQKGSCKFGHKCALAHLLPGQPMSMDRKNKRAVQLQAQALNNGLNPAQVHPTQPDLNVAANRSLASTLASLQTQSANSGMMSALSQQIASSPLSHQTGSSTMPATPPADVLSNGWHTDMSSALDGSRISGTRTLPQGVHTFHSLSELSVTPTSSGLSPSPPSTAVNQLSRPVLFSSHTTSSGPSGLNPSRDPLAIPSSARRPSFPAALSSASLFSSSPSRRLIPPLSSSVNVSGDASPFSSSPFAAPGGKSLFLSSSYENHFMSTADQMAFSPPGHQSGGKHLMTSPPGALRRPTAVAEEEAHYLSSLSGNDPEDEEFIQDDVVDDDEGEEFLPGSLSELLTDNEMERRMIRRHSNQIAPLGLKALSKSAAPTFPIGQGRSVLKMGFSTGNGTSPWDGTAQISNGAPNPDNSLSSSAGLTVGRNSTGGGRGPLSFRQLTSTIVTSPMAHPEDPTVLMNPQSSFNHTSVEYAHQDSTPTSASAALANTPWDSQSSLASRRSYAAAASPPLATQQTSRVHSAWPSPSAMTTATAANPNLSPKNQLGHPHLHEPTYTQPILSPSSKALASHPPGTSLPPGLGAASSRLHFIPATSPSMFTPFGSVAGNAGGGGYPDRSSTSSSASSVSTSQAGLYSDGQNQPFSSLTFQTQGHSQQAQGIQQSPHGLTFGTAVTLSSSSSADRFGRSSIGDGRSINQEQNQQQRIGGIQGQDEPFSTAVFRNVWDRPDRPNGYETGSKAAGGAAVGGPRYEGRKVGVENLGTGEPEETQLYLDSTPYILSSRD
ncbi:zinc ccch-type cps3 [Phaffia rhodozyma]|uniref:Zinc ccch-type cps3 n=1 Tax=Phaffia rhodozyma TaxID=264483 RepID=A0A0F7SJW0_PHARH|nr:zinc ccch-type cps3 [Phaffia rhodozyma]